MAGITPWLDGNWFNLLQALGIIGTLLFAGIGVHREAKAREVENLLTLAAHHRELWSHFIGKKELERVFNPSVNLNETPPTVAETEFLNLLIVQIQTGWRIATGGGITSLNEMQSDIQGTFSLPLPRAVWEQTKRFRNRKFVRFVEAALKAI